MTNPFVIFIFTTLLFWSIVLAFKNYLESWLAILTLRVDYKLMTQKEQLQADISAQREIITQAASGISDATRQFEQVSEQQRQTNQAQSDTIAILRAKIAQNNAVPEDIADELAALEANTRQAQTLDDPLAAAVAALKSAGEQLAQTPALTVPDEVPPTASGLTQVPETPTGAPVEPAQPGGAQVDATAPLETSTGAVPGGSFEAVITPTTSSAPVENAAPEPTADEPPTA